MINLSETYNSIELIQDKNDDWKIICVSGRLKKGKLEKLSFHNFNELKILKNFLSNNSCYLTISSAQILIKNVNQDIALLEDNITGLFPNFDPNIFHFQFFEAYQKKYVAIARKQYITSILHNFEKNNIQVQGISFAFLSLATILPDVAQKQIQTYRYKIDLSDELVVKTFDDNNLSNFTSISLASENFSSEYAIGISTLIAFLEKKLEGNTSFIKLNDKLSTKVEQNLFFKKILYLSLFLLLLFCIINTTIYLYYYQKTEQLKKTYPTDLNLVEKIDSLTKHINNKKRKIYLIRKQEKYYNQTIKLNNLISKIPEDITLTSIQLAPPITPLRTNNKEKLLEFEHNKIIVDGYTNSEPSFSQWIAEIQNDRTFKNISIANILWNPDRNYSEFQVAFKY